MVITHLATPCRSLFVAKLIEAARISWYTRDRLVQELNVVRAAQQDQAALLETQLQQLELNARLAKVGQRTAELSHDMRNPLTTVVGTVDLIETALRQTPPNTAEALDLTLSMHTALDHVLELVRRITRQASEPVAPQQLVLVENVVANALALCKRRLASVAVTIDVPTDLRVKGWSTELTQLLVNLVINSCDALQGHTRPWIRIGAEESDGELELRVVDAGQRPPPSVIDKMFVTRFTTGNTARFDRTRLDDLCANRTSASRHNRGRRTQRQHNHSDSSPPRARCLMTGCFRRYLRDLATVRPHGPRPAAGDAAATSLGLGENHPSHLSYCLLGGISDLDLGSRPSLRTRRSLYWLEKHPVAAAFIRVASLPLDSRRTRSARSLAMKYRRSPTNVTGASVSLSLVNVSVCKLTSRVSRRCSSPEPLLRSSNNCPSGRIVGWLTFQSDNHAIGFSDGAVARVSKTRSSPTPRPRLLALARRVTT